jgi:hypothetical protein
LEIEVSETKVWGIVLIAAAIYWLAGCETKDEKEKRELMERIEDLECETEYLLQKMEKNRH